LGWWPSCPVGFSPPQSAREASTPKPGRRGEVDPTVLALEVIGLAILGACVADLPSATLRTRFYTPAYRAARRYLRNDREAREVAEAVVNLILARFVAGKLGEEQTKRFEQDDDMDTYVRRYLRRAAKHAAIDHRRCEAAEDRRRKGLAKQAVALDGAGDPMELSCYRETIAHVHAALSDLPEKLRQVLQLYYVEGKTCREIAEETNTPKGTIQYRLSQARRRLRDCLPDSLLIR
jgi:RNA polymerase sigma factor (sigma-70 family)